MKFSERIGKKTVKEKLQVESIDLDLKNRLWNLYLEQFKDKLCPNDSFGDSAKMQVSKYLWKEFFKQPIYMFPTAPFSSNFSITEFTEYLRKWFYKAEWFEIYDFIEELCHIDENRNANLDFARHCNMALEKEVSGYRLINDKITELTSIEQIQAIEEAFANVDCWSSVKIHLSQALNFLSDRTSPNYRNSLKESISAVESLCKIITEDEKTTLGKALRLIEKKHSIHGALKSAFMKIYGYTSDSGGIRHALLDKDSTVDADEAKFMLISCSAFINYIISKSI